MLTREEKDHLIHLNVKNHYGVSKTMLIRMTKEHRKARKNGDIHKMECIEYRLEYINFHHEVGMMYNGEYDALLKEIEQEF